ncbi:MAG TPA: SPOR domain-containing protein [Rectinemataceae bacterium]|nr:SPOR domain-containing protein [Rectinemataceae bacterium]
MKRAFGCTAVILIIAATLAACDNGPVATNPPVALTQNAWIPAEQLLVPVPLPNNGQYALQAGQFASMDGAVAVDRRIMTVGLVSSVIPVVDNSGQYWYIIAVGDYPSPVEARDQRSSISAELGISDNLPVILLPQAYTKP